ncbi:MAG: enoyl-CoA hydratase/isomerase family protein [Flavobacteriaceae bacterium]
MKVLELNVENTVAIIRLNNGKVNAINHQLASELGTVFSELETDDTVSGIVLTGSTGAFSAGLDVVEVAQQTEEEARAFWVAYFGALQAMVRYSKPFVCAITGFAPAGATILTLCADYRIMAQEPKHVIGMHEFKLSMQVPELMMDIWCYTLGEQKAFQALQNATLFSAQDALQENIVQEIAPAAEVLPKALAHMEKCLNVYAPVYIESKRLARKHLLALVDRDLDQLATDFVAFGKDPQMRKRIAEFAERLKQK